jgi:hypothetical protein
MVLLKIIGSALASIAALALGLARLKWPDEAFWNSRLTALVAASVWIAAWSVFDTAERSYGAWKGKKEKRLAIARRDGEQVLKGALMQVQRLSGLDLSKIGLHLFLVGKKWQVGWPLRFEYQMHTVRVKMSEYPPPTGIVFTNGKGVIGLCWKTKSFQALDVRRAYAQYMDATQEEWDKLTDDQRFGLTYDEFLRTKEHTGTILAAPLLEGMGTKYLGCVSLDAPGDCFASLSTPQVKEVLQLTATTVAALVRSASAS